MARMRMLKAEFFTDSILGKLPREARLLFQSTWIHADDWGLGEVDPALFKLECLGYDDDVSIKRIAELFEMLAKAKRIRIYRDGSKKYYHVTKMLDHQRIDKPGLPKFPLPKFPIREPKLQGDTLNEFREQYGRNPRPFLERSKNGRPEEKRIEENSTGGESEGRDTAVHQPAEEDLSQSTPTTDLDLGRDVISWMEATANGQRFRKHWAHKGKASRGPTENMKGTLREKERTIGAENFRQAWVDFLASGVDARWPYRKFMDTALDKRMEELVEAQVQGRHAAEVAQEAEERNLGFPG